MSIVFWIIQQIGIVGVVFVGMLGFYEGVPGLRDLPGISYVPFVREFIVGRVQIERGKAADAAREGFVSRTELKTAQAEAASLRWQLLQNALFTDAARQQAETARKQADAAQEELDKRIAADSDPDISRWRQLDLDRLQHR